MLMELRRNPSKKYKVLLMIQASKIIGTGLATTLLNDDFYYSLSCSNFFHEYYILDTFVYLFALPPPLGGGGFPPP
jgi:hypothetical protein